MKEKLYQPWVLGTAAIAIALGSFMGGGLYVGYLWGMSNPFKLSALNKPADMVIGQLVNKTSNSVVIKGIDGQPRKVLINRQTTVEFGQRLELGDVAEGATVSAFGPVDKEGTITAALLRVTAMPTPAQ